MIFNLPRERLQNEPFSFPPFLRAYSPRKIRWTLQTPAKGRLQFVSPDAGLAESSAKMEQRLDLLAESELCCYENVDRAAPLEERLGEPGNLQGK